MDDIIKQTIDMYYNKRRDSEYLLKCKTKHVFSEEMNTFVSQKNIILYNLYHKDVWTSDKFIINYPDFTNKEFEVSYHSNLLISRIAPVYYLEHGFEMKNKDPNQTIPILDGFDIQSYTKTQQELSNLVEYELSNYLKLTIADLNEVLCEINIPYDQSILFNRQLTVEQALFHDILGLCPE